MNLPSLDWMNLLFLPLMVITVLEVKKNWASIVDDNLTSHDRYLLQRTVIFLLMPIVVYCHEMGHVMAIKYFGGQVKEFHYAFVWGYVVPQGLFTQTELVWCYFAGNLVQILVGYLSAVMAFVVRAPYLVALFTYLALWSVAGTVILYALMSFTGLYGDWLAIYTAPVPDLVAGIAIFHAFAVGLVLYALYGYYPRYWFVSKTNPPWVDEQRLLHDMVKQDPSVAHWTMLAKSYLQAGFTNQAKQCIEKAKIRAR